LGGSILKIAFQKKRQPDPSTVLSDGTGREVRAEHTFELPKLRGGLPRSKVGWGGGDLLAGQRSKVGCGRGTFKVHLARS
jgi:hypothetical protein